MTGCRGLGMCLVTRVMGSCTLNRVMPSVVCVLPDQCCGLDTRFHALSALASQYVKCRGDVLMVCVTK